MAARHDSTSSPTCTGPSKCFRKFINGGPVYGADVMVLGGDLAGKAIQTIVRGPRRQVQLAAS